MTAASEITDNHSLKLFLAFSIFLLAGVGLAIYCRNSYFLAIPLALLFLGIVLTNYKIVYYLLLVSIPFSIEVDLPGGFGTDLFSEPLIIILAGCYLGTWLLGNNPDKPFLHHPLVKLTGALLLWAIAVSIISVDSLKSWKYVVAKSWYLLVFLFLTASLLKSSALLQKILSFYIGALAVVVSLVLVRHYLVGFTFESANRIVTPFFRNHVMYGVISAAALPYAAYLFYQQRAQHGRRVLWGLVFLLLLAGVTFSYTRASWLSLPLALLYGIFIRFRLTRYLLILSAISALVAVSYLGSNYRYMQYAPDYEKTIFHKGNLPGHLRATYKLQDVSGMERIYRWIAAVRMVAERPFTGSGPNTFYPEYKKYTVSRFTTYVSDNQEKSTAHNYFLLQFVEQGLPAGILFLIFIGYALMLPEKIYHQTPHPDHKRTALAAGLCLFIIIVHLLLNELLETDKIGSLFYISLAALIRLDNQTAAPQKIMVNG